MSTSALSSACAQAALGLAHRTLAGQQRSSPVSTRTGQPKPVTPFAQIKLLLIRCDFYREASCMLVRDIAFLDCEWEGDGGTAAKDIFGSNAVRSMCFGAGG